MRRVGPNKHIRKPRKDSRTISVYGHPEFGDGEDHKRYYRCWNCGFICDSERDALGGPDDRSGIQPDDYEVHAYGDYSTGGLWQAVGVQTTCVICLGGDINHFHVALENGSDGQPKKVGHKFAAPSKRGCPFCGCTNWRGDF